MYSYVGAVVIQVSYGMNDPAYNSKLIDDAEAIVEGFAEVSVPGRFLVDVLPILRFVPAWFPGAGWKRRLQAYGRKSKEVYEQNFEACLERSVSLFSCIYDRRKLSSADSGMVLEESIPTSQTR